MPDVLGISQDALCPDSACEQAQHETGSAEPCEHQLDLLIVSDLCLRTSTKLIKSLTPITDLGLMIIIPEH